MPGQNLSFASRIPHLDLDLTNHLLGTLPIAFAYADVKLSLVRCNALFLKVCGASDDYSQGMPLRGIVDERIWKDFKSAYAQALLGKIVADTPLTPPCRSAQTSPQEMIFSFYPVCESGNIVGVGIAVRTESIYDQTQLASFIDKSALPATATRPFLAEMLDALTEGKLILCATQADLPAPLSSFLPTIPLTPDILCLVRRKVREAAECIEMDDFHASDFILGVGEAMDNVLVHAGGGSAQVLMDDARGVLQVRVSDLGHGIADQIIHRAALERGYTTAGTLGQGFFLMLNTCDRVWLLTSPSGTTVVMEQYRQQR